ncbi:hypothetical protein HPQ64_14215 [Rhizobiales bacterium]|uniref:hypothetical protein n=1 Tax=Hongsoonwoonella zoysiae TaxID=2821844 RepID=UPI001560D99A|nr:hypothetical protein [Hongsoonwoonella zoysiae]NRG18843.1 hypothetical protein [Hongsoonwoonella zoysiae]
MLEMWQLRNEQTFSFHDKAKLLVSTPIKREAQMLSAIGRWSLVLASAFAALIIAIVSADQGVETNVAKKGDRALPLVHVACKDIVVTDASKACDDIAKIAGTDQTAYVTEAKTFGQTTVLVRTKLEK